MLRKIQLMYRHWTFKHLCRHVVDTGTHHIVVHEAHRVNDVNWSVNPQILNMSWKTDLEEWLFANAYHLMFKVTLFPHRANGKLGWKLTISHRTANDKVGLMEWPHNED